MKMDPSHKTLTLSPMEKVRAHLVVQEICHLDGQTEVEEQKKKKFILQRAALF